MWRVVSRSILAWRVVSRSIDYLVDGERRGDRPIGGEVLLRGAHRSVEQERRARRRLVARERRAVGAHGRARAVRVRVVVRKRGVDERRATVGCDAVGLEELGRVLWHAACEVDGRGRGEVAGRCQVAPEVRQGRGSVISPSRESTPHAFSSSGHSQPLSREACYALDAPPPPPVRAGLRAAAAAPAFGRTVAAKRVLGHVAVHQVLRRQRHVDLAARGDAEAIAQRLGRRERPAAAARALRGRTSRSDETRGSAAAVSSLFTVGYCWR